MRATVIPLVALDGIVDGAGIVFFLYSTYTGLFSMSALLKSFYPRDDEGVPAHLPASV
jgi:hypothetical protein